MVTDLPILSDIISGVVARVNVITQADVDSFPVVFRFGPVSQVSKEVYEVNDMVIWLIEKGEDRTKAVEYGAATVDIIIALPTVETWTMDERMNTNYKPKLLPVYELLLNELKTEKKLSVSRKVDHRKYNLYYWGGGSINGTNAPNLWEKMIDAILIENAQLPIRNNNC
jgi:hypothetical protein